MHWFAFLAACLALILARSLRAPKRSGIFFGSLIFLTAFVATTITVRTMAINLGVTRPSEYDAFVVDAVNTVKAHPDEPLAVFVGASFSRNGLDDEKLTADLRAKGYPHRVINLSLQGASLQERDAHLRAFMHLTGRAPDVVFLEVAREFDRDPTYVFQVAKFSDRAIEQMSPDAVYWSMKGLAQGQCDGKAACLKSLGLLNLHAAMNLSNIGLLSTGEAVSDIKALSSFDPQDTPRKTFTLELPEIEAHLIKQTGITPSDGPAWARLFRKNQRDRLLSQGVRRVAYYYPPVLPEGDREYVAGLCAGELSDFPCIAPVDTKLLAQLNGQVWFDEKHLLRDGAEVYTDWLADQIDRWGALK